MVRVLGGGLWPQTPRPCMALQQRTFPNHPHVALEPWRCASATEKPHCLCYRVEWQWELLPRSCPWASPRRSGRVTECISAIAWGLRWKCCFGKAAPAPRKSTEHFHITVARLSVIPFLSNTLNLVGLFESLTERFSICLSFPQMAPTGSAGQLFLRSCALLTLLPKPHIIILFCRLSSYLFFCVPDGITGS